MPEQEIVNSISTGQTHSFCQHHEIPSTKKAQAQKALNWYKIRTNDTRIVFEGKVIPPHSKESFSSKSESTEQDNTPRQPNQAPELELGAQAEPLLGQKRAAPASLEDSAEESNPEPEESSLSQMEDENETVIRSPKTPSAKRLTTSHRPVTRSVTRQGKAIQPVTPARKRETEETTQARQVGEPTDQSSATSSSKKLYERYPRTRKGNVSSAVWINLLKTIRSLPKSTKNRQHPPATEGFVPISSPAPKDSQQTNSTEVVNTTRVSENPEAILSTSSSLEVLQTFLEGIENQPSHWFGAPGIHNITTFTLLLNQARDSHRTKSRVPKPHQEQREEPSEITNHKS